MQDLNGLRGKMDASGRAALARMRLGDAAPIRRERDRLLQWLGRAAAPDAAHTDRIVAAIAAYRNTGCLINLRQLRLLCYGCTQVVDAQNYRLIEDRPLFEQLLGYVARQRPRVLRKCYFGLLGAYCAYDTASPDATAAGRGSHEALRQFLDGQRGFLDATGFTPPWVAALAAHPRLFARDPRRAYGFETLQGDWALLDDIHERLNVGSESWLMRELVLGQVDGVVGLGDAAFVRGLAAVLLLLDRHPLHAASGLGRLLDRQARCAGAEVSQALCEQALALWGNPWLPRSAHLWQCGAAARQMVARWLRRRLLRGFFALFAEDDATNRRRRAFWEACSDDLVGMYFALGKAAFAPGNPARRKFRHAARGLVVRLEDAVPDRHVLILQFARHHVVELSGANDVAYFYAIEHGIPPFYLSKGWMDVGAVSVNRVAEGKSLAPTAKALAHKDTDTLRWEERFTRELGVAGPSPAAVPQRGAWLAPAAYAP